MSFTGVHCPRLRSLWVRVPILRSRRRSPDPRANLEFLFSSCPVRGLHQELQCSVQPSAEASGGRRRPERWGCGQSSSSRTTVTASYRRTHHVLLPATCHGCAKGETRFPQQRSVQIHLNACSPPGRPALLLHAVVWILLGPQPHHHPTGQTGAGKRRHRCGQVQ